MVVGDVAVDMTATMASEPVAWDSNSPTMDLNAGGSAGNVAGALGGRSSAVPSPDGVALEEFGARDVEVVNTLGAGDTFDAGFIAAALGGLCAGCRPAGVTPTERSRRTRICATAASRCAA